MKKWICLALMLLSQAVTAEMVTCKVVGLSDGDTFTCLDLNKQQYKVRLGNIDTPEKKQPYGTRARQELSKLIFPKLVAVEIQDVDRYGRSIGIVFLDGTNINRVMVARGAAWVYRQYNRDPTLLAVEAKAKASRAGLWALPESQAIPPWEWRRNVRYSSASSPPQSQTSNLASDAPTTVLNCGKRTCGQMTSCAEARFHLEKCNVTSLDGDRDGVPCERLCR